MKSRTLVMTTHEIELSQEDVLKAVLQYLGPTEADKFKNAEVRIRKKWDSYQGSYDGLVLTRREYA